MRAILVAMFVIAVLSLGFSCKEPKDYHYKAYGTVTDEQGNPLDGVSVVLNGYDIQRTASVEAVTDSTGAFLITFDLNPFDWRQEAHWVFLLRKDGYVTRSVTYPEFSFDDRFRYQGYWYKVYFRVPVAMKKVAQDVVPAAVIEPAAEQPTK